MEDMITLAKGLQNSNIKEVAELAKAYMGLAESYKELRHAYVKSTSDKIMRDHAKTFQALADAGD